MLREEGATLKALIVDDEYPAREELRYLLQSFPEVEIVGEAAQASEALELIRNIDYDLCFLDVKMPGSSGIDLVRELGRVPHRPAVIFVTAYPDFAVDAFDLDAVDYILKPFDEARLGRALQRLLDRGNEAAPSELQPVADDGAWDIDKVPIPHGDRTDLLDSHEIVYATAARGYSYIVTSQERHLVPYSLAEMERRLRGDRFFRTHRAYLINLAHATAIEADFKGALQVLMEGTEERVPVSRRQARVLKRLLGL